MNRRSFVLGMLGAAAAGTWGLRPRDNGSGGHDDYFGKLGAELRRAGLARPTMLLDLDLLDRNIAETAARVAPRKLRVVAKSLPSAALLAYVMEKAGTDLLMSFHQPFLNAIAAAHPRTQLLLGKPLPVKAADRFYEQLRVGEFDPARQVQWLIDTPARLAQYAELARGRDLHIAVNVEIDVGLHRGGLGDPSELVRMLAAIDAYPNLRFGGLMGYDPHAVKVPDILGSRAREFEAVQSRYRGFLEAWRRHSGGGDEGELVLNAAGSPTYRLWDAVEGIANELAVGSGLVKPLDFDIPTLSAHVPALFIATPVLKTSDGVRIPGVEAIGRLQRLWDPNCARTFFVYGGYWKARPVSPAGLQTNSVYGRSSNQEMLNGSVSVALELDDYVFYRPEQSEFIMLQFGDIAVLRGGRIVDFWAPLPQAA